MTTKQSEIINDDRYVAVHNHGFVGLLETMGTDETIEQTARISYASKTRSIDERTNLLRYLMRNKHTSPFEHGVFRFHLKMPIFIARQWMRHRMASINEQSGRYTEITDEFFVPDTNTLMTQSKTNKQGRDESQLLDENSRNDFLSMYEFLSRMSYNTYQSALFMGLTKELARITLPNSLYTEFYWKIDLHNLFHFLKLRTDEHAQKEIRDYANVLECFVQENFPICYQAYLDYSKHARTFSTMELQVLNKILNGLLSIDDIINSTTEDAKNWRMSSREHKEFVQLMKSWKVEPF